jgi:hypothetical protein
MKLNNQLYLINFYVFKIITHYNDMNKMNEINEMNQEISSIKVYQEFIILFYFSQYH